MLRIDFLTELMLYGAVLLGYLPLAPWLQRLPAFAVPVAIIFAIFAGRKGVVLKERPALLLSVGCFVYYALQFSRHNVAEPAANMLAILLAIRLAGEKSIRNFLQNIALALFCLAASTLFDLSPRFVIYLLLLLLIFTSSLVLLTFQSSAPDYWPPPSELRSILSVALLQPLTALPLIVFLFFILPRTQFPLWHGISAHGTDKTGISDTVTPGDKSAVSSGKATIFRAEMVQLPPEELYWRVIVLNAFKGDVWVRVMPPDEGRNSRPPADQVRQTIFLEPGSHKFLPTLNTPASIAWTRGSPSIDRVFPAGALFAGRRNYSVVSQNKGVPLSPRSVDIGFYTTLPQHVPPRLLALARDIGARGEDSGERLQLLKNAFAGMGLSYTASGLPTGADAMDRFLFIDKKGHCELFATSFATALRGAGVPARLVGGYYGGIYNELAGYYAVTEERAHLWVEAWLEGEGWVTVDPSQFAVNFAEARRVAGSPAMLRLQMLADTFNYYWVRAVVTYDLESQLSAISKVGAGLRSFKTDSLSLRRLAIGAGCLMLLAAALWLAARGRETPEARLLRAFRKALQRRYGLTIPESSGLHEGIRGVDDAAVREFVDLYTGAVYHDRRLDSEEKKRLWKLLADIGHKRG